MVIFGRLLPLCLVLGTSTLAQAGTSSGDRALEDLGRALFFDTRLSANGNLSCASCHDPAQGFVDPGTNRLGGAVSLGDDGRSLGDRNAPSVTYAAFTPDFHRDNEGQIVGGLFWDGRAATLADQAMGPPLNPGEMGMPDMEAVRQRLLENPDYVVRIGELFGPETLDDAGRTYRAMAESIAAFERTDTVSPFDAKYDRYLRGEYQFTEQEELGRTLFFSQQFTNCNRCHQLETSPMAARETFTNYRYHNIGVPVNEKVRAANGMEQDYVDPGLLNNPNLVDWEARGRYKVPSLRNVAVTGPYMHNGVFNDLETVIRFYNHYNSRSEKSQINPETGRHWREPEVAENVSLTDLEHGPALDERRIEALVAFLETLTDKRYEPLLEARKTAR
ncbi:MAG: methylamine utilization protein MauG [Oceanospirillaceae bacterium]|nr:methylamine utilization protein MauG [Oceanospirillaceae bacterium]